MSEPPGNSGDRPRVSSSEDTGRLAPVAALRADGREFRLGHQVGRGTFSFVYAASDNWGNALAMKVMELPTYRNFFRREARALTALRHPNVVNLHAAFEHGPRAFLALDRCVGSLADLAPPPDKREKVCVLVANGLLQALDHIHRSGYVHGDVCPGNVLVKSVSPTPSDIQLSDFSFCVPVRRMDRFPPMQAAWQAPPEGEAARGPATEVWFASLMLLQLLTGTKHATAQHESALEQAGPLGLALAPGLAGDPQARPTAAALWRRLARAVRPAAPARPRTPR